MFDQAVTSRQHDSVSPRASQDSCGVSEPPGVPTALLLKLDHLFQKGVLRMLGMRKW